MPEPVFATCSYGQFVPEMGLPVRITAGPPNRGLSYDLAGEIPQFAPFGNTLRYEFDDFRRAYRAKLHRQWKHGMDAARQILADAGAAEGTPLVLLCFEDLADPYRPDLWCHRTILAQFLRQKTSVEVPEFGDHFVAFPVALPEPEPLTLDLVGLPA